MVWEVEFTDEFGVWWDALTEAEQESVDATVHLLEVRGPSLAFPHSSGITASTHRHMRELRVQNQGRRASRPLCIRSATHVLSPPIHRIAGDDRWYEKNVRIADKLYEEHIAQLRREGLIDDG